MKVTHRKNRIVVSGILHEGLHDIAATAAHKSGGTISSFKGTEIVIEGDPVAYRREFDALVAQ